MEGETAVIRRRKVSEAFSQLDNSDLARLAVELRPLQLAGGEVLFRQGDAGDSLYIVDHGRLAVVVRTSSGQDVRLAELGDLELVGEGSLLTGAPRSATVVAVRDTALVQLSREGFQRLVANRPDTAVELARKIMKRLQLASSGTPAPRPVSTVAIVRAGAAPAEEEVARLVAAEIGRSGRVLVVTSAFVDEKLGPGHAQAPASDPKGAATRRWLNEIERDYTVVVYLGDPGPSEWSRLSLRQADRVILAGRRSAPPALGPLERELLPVATGLAERELVLLDDGKGGSSASGWLKDRKVSRHHFVSARGGEDAARLVRFLLGKAHGLVLGGGGARTFAHLGALRALREAGVPIDAIGGSSGGALFGAFFAVSGDLDHMVRETRKRFLKSGPLFQLVVPATSLISGRAFMRMVEAWFGTTLVEDLGVPYFCVSTNITKNRLEIHRDGPLATWVLASMAIPGVGPPIVRDGDILVDGCVASILPTPEMRASGVGTVIGVDVAARTGLGFPGVGIGPAPSGTRALARHFRARAKEKPPLLFDLLLGAALFGGDVSRQEAAADLLVRPPLDRYSPTDFAALDELVAHGYEATRDALDPARAARTGDPVAKTA